MGEGGKIFGYLLVYSTILHNQLLGKTLIVGIRVILVVVPRMEL